jgi:hypothetical protein
MFAKPLKHPKVSAGRSGSMQFVLTGFTHDVGFRVFAFERIGDDRIRTTCVVRADLALARSYGIQLQELPLLCRGLLERSEEAAKHSLNFTEQEMRACAAERAAARSEALKKRRPPHKPTGENIGIAWRAPHV